LTQQEQMAHRLVSIYRPFVTGHRGYSHPITKNHGDWKYFLGLAETIIKIGANPYKFISTIFQERGMLYPPQLDTKENWEIYKLAKDIEVYDRETEIARKLLVTFNIVKDWSKINGFDISNYSAFLKNIKNKFLLHRHDINPELFLFTKSFYNNLTQKERNEIIPNGEVKRMIIFSHKKILDKLKEILKDEFAGNLPENKPVQQVQSVQEQDSELFI
jgi:hypothetical protein